VVYGEYFEEWKGVVRMMGKVLTLLADAVILLVASGALGAVIVLALAWCGRGCHD
jgi:hypothetical protein